MSLTIASLALGVVSNLFGADASKDAGKKARALGRENAKFIGLETAEEKRRLAFRQEQIRSTVDTNIAASGFRSGAESKGASHKAYQASMRSEQQKELDWLQLSGDSRAKIARAGGNAAKSQMDAQAFGQYAKAGQGLFGIIDELNT